MLVVSILLILIFLITAILIFGGREQRRENRILEKERQVAIKEAKKAIKDKNKESSNKYTDILKNVEKKASDDGQEEYNYENNKEENEKAENFLDDENKEDKDSNFIGINREYQENIEDDVNYKVKEEPYENEKNTGNLNIDKVNNKLEEDTLKESDVQFFLDDFTNSNSEDKLDIYMKEAQANDIGYLNGNEKETKTPKKTGATKKQTEKDKNQ